MIVDHTDLVETKSIDVIFREEKLCVLNEKVPHSAVGICEDQSTGPTLIREIQASVVVAVGTPIEKVQALFVKVATGMVVDEIEDHRNSIQMEKIDKRS